MKLHYSQTVSYSDEIVTFVLLPYEITLFSNPYNSVVLNKAVLLPYEITLFSNRVFEAIIVSLFYYLMKLHYSQTSVLSYKAGFSFTTL